MINLLYWGIGVIVCTLAFTKIPVGIRSMFKCSEKHYRTIVVIIIAALCFAPIIVDIISSKRPLSYYEDEMITVELPESIENNIGELLEGHVIEQSFYCNYPYLRQINLYTQTYGRKNRGELHAELINIDNDEVIYEWNLKLEDVPDNDYLELVIDNPTSLEVQNHMFEIKLTAEPENEWRSVTIAAVEDTYGYGEASFDGDVINQDLIFNVVGYSNVYSKEMVRVWICILIMLLSSSILWGVWRK